MPKDLKPVILYGLLAFTASILLSYYVPRWKRAPSPELPQIYGISITSPTTVKEAEIKKEDVKEDEVKIPVQKVRTLTEEELNQMLSAEFSKQKKSETDTMKASVNASNVLLYVSSQGIQINLKLKLTQNKRSFDVESYTLNGLGSYDESVKREFANLIASGIFSAITNGLEQADIKEIVLADKSVAVVYTQN